MIIKWNKTSIELKAQKRGQRRGPATRLHSKRKNEKSKSTEEVQRSMKGDEIHKSRIRTYMHRLPTHNSLETKKGIRLVKMISRDKHPRLISHRGATLQ